MTRNDILQIMLDHEPSDQLRKIPFDATDFFFGVIDSLGYNPNTKVLVIVGEDNEIFMDNISLCIGSGIYDSMFYGIDFTKDNLGIAYRDDFIIRERKFKYPECDKRLASYVSIVRSWHYPDRKNFTVANVNNLNSIEIDRCSLWAEILKLYKYGKDNS